MSHFLSIRASVTHLAPAIVQSLVFCFAVCYAQLLSPKSFGINPEPWPQRLPNGGQYCWQHRWISIEDTLWSVVIREIRGFVCVRKCHRVRLWLRRILNCDALIILLKCRKLCREALFVQILKIRKSIAKRNHCIYTTAFVVRWH